MYVSEVDINCCAKTIAGSLKCLIVYITLMFVAEYTVVI